MPNPQNISKHKFKKGTSGNPKGRPKKLPQLDSLIADVLGEDGNGKSQAEQILRALSVRAKKGDVKAAALLFDRAWGKARENEGKPTEMIIRVVRRS